MNPEFALPNLLNRPRYCATGICKPVFLLYFILICAVMVVFGLLASVMATAITATGPGSRDFARSMSPVLSFLFGIAMLMIPSVGVIWLIGKAHLQSWVVLFFASITWAACFVVGLWIPNYPSMVAALEAGESWPVFVMIFGAFLIIPTTMVIFQTVCSEVFSVYYPEHDDWARRYFVYFKPGMAKKVAELIELGALRELAELRTEGPNAVGPAWQSFTSMILSMPPEGKTGSYYLHVKSVILGGGPLFTKRVHSCLGHASLRHVEMSPHEIEKIAWLFPELSEGKAPDPAIAAGPSTGKMRVLGFQGGMSAPRIETESGSYIEQLDNTEKRFLRLRFWLGFTSFFQIMLGLGFFLPMLEIIGAMGVSDSGAFKVITEGVSILLILLIFGSAICFALIARWCLVRGVRTRKNKRFQPTRHKSVVLNMEESTSYSQTKFLPEDYGLMNISPEGLDFEFSDFRVHLEPKDVQLDYHTVSGGTGLRIFAKFPDGVWSITVSDPVMRMGLAIYMNPKKRAEDLWRRIYEGLQPPGSPPSAPQEPRQPTQGIEL